MKKKSVVVDIAKDGGVKIEVNGVTGPACLDLTRDLENALGSVANREKKKEGRDEHETRRINQ